MFGCGPVAETSHKVRAAMAIFPRGHLKTEKASWQGKENGVDAKKRQKEIRKIKERQIGTLLTEFLPTRSSSPRGPALFLALGF